MYPSLPWFVCLFFVTLAVATDLTCRRIPNWITVPAAAGALCFHGLEQGAAQGVAQALGGWAVGCLLLMVPFRMGGMGGGDVKLLGAIGAWLGWRDVLNVFIYGAWVGALWALVLMARAKSLGSLWKALGMRRLPPADTSAAQPVPRPRQEMPYAVAIGAGYAVLLCYGHLV